MKTPFVFASLALTSFASTAFAGDVFVVGPGGSYTTIQAAIDAAADYDTILVESQAASYAGFNLNGRSLAIVGRRGNLPTPPVVIGETTVDTTPGGGMVVLGRLDIRASGYGENALRTTNNSGAVWMEGCTFRGASGGELSAYAGPAAEVESDADTQFTACTIKAGNCGYSWIGTFHGPRALFAQASTMRLIDCTITGGKGSTEADSGEGYAGGYGGAAFELDGGLALAIGTSFVGGNGGTGGYDEGIFCPDYGGSGGGGGSGIVVSSSTANAEVRTRGGSIAGGQGGGGGGSDCGLSGPSGPDGVPVYTTANGTWTELTGVARHLSGIPSARENTDALLTATGAPGDKVYLQIGAIGPQPTPGPVGAPMHLPVRPAYKPEGVYIGTVPASGTLNASLPLGSLPPNTESMWLKLRTLFVDTSGATFYGNSFVLIVLDSPY